MSIRLTNPSYSYSAGGVIAVSATVDIIAPDDVTVLYQGTVSANAHLGGDWKNELQSSLTKQAGIISENYTRAMAVAKVSFPIAKSPADALAQFIAEVQAALTGV